MDGIWGAAGSWAHSTWWKPQQPHAWSSAASMQARGQVICLRCAWLCRQGYSTDEARGWHQTRQLVFAWMSSEQRHNNPGPLWQVCMGCTRVVLLPQLPKAVLYAGGRDRGHDARDLIR